MQILFYRNGSDKKKLELQRPFCFFNSYKPPVKNPLVKANSSIHPAVKRTPAKKTQE